MAEGGEREKSCIDDLANGLAGHANARTSRRAPRSPSLSQFLSEEGDRDYIENAVHHANTDELIEGAPVVNREDNPFKAEVV